MSMRSANFNSYTDTTSTNVSHLTLRQLTVGLYQQVHQLFSTKEEPTVVFHGGIYKGSAGVKRLYIDSFQKRFVGGRNGPNYGFLLDHPQLQEIINIDNDGIHASARARSLMQAG